MASAFPGQAVPISFIPMTAANWAANSTRILEPYEMAYQTDNHLFKIGDGSSAWSVLGYQNSGRNINSQSAAYGFVIGDAGSIILHPTADDNARMFTIPANSAVPFPIGSELKIINQKNTITIAITTDTMNLEPGGTTGSRTLAADNNCTITKVAATVWVISGTSGLT